MKDRAQRSKAPTAGRVYGEARFPRARRPAPDLVAAGLVAVGLASPGFLALVTVVGLLRPGYDMVADEISQLGLGATAAITDGGFAVFGGLLVLFSAGLWRSFRFDHDAVAGSILLGLTGLGVAALALFPTDPGPRHLSQHGMLHDVALGIAVTGFLAAGVEFSRVFRRLPRWRRLAAYTRANILWLAALWPAWAFLSDRQPYDLRPPLGAASGLIERLGVLAMSAWIAAVALHHTRLVLAARRSASDGPSDRPARALDQHSPLT
jgi:hypothetical membrane protein